jgi:hypothetical protein
MGWTGNPMIGPTSPSARGLPPPLPGLSPQPFVGGLPIVFSAPSFSQAMKRRSNLKSSPHSCVKKRRTFWVLR